VERGNKRSPRIDDEMDRETRALLQSGSDESRAEAALVKEGELEDEVAAAGPPWAEGPAVAGDPSGAEVELRSEVARALRPSEFPATGAELVAAARAVFAPDDVIDLLRRLPAEATFPTVEAVWEQVGGHREHRT
jgi:hypothetical protein